MQPQDRLAFSPIATRPPLKLPDGLRLILWPLMSLEQWDISRPMARMVITPPQGQPMLPDHPNWSWHEYGMRVGFWRLKRVFERLKMTPTVTVNGRACDSGSSAASPIRTPIRRTRWAGCALAANDHAYAPSTHPAVPPPRNAMKCRLFMYRPTKKLSWCPNMFTMWDPPPSSHNRSAKQLNRRRLIANNKMIVSFDRAVAPRHLFASRLR